MKGDEVDIQATVAAPRLWLAVAAGDKAHQGSRLTKRVARGDGLLAAEGAVSLIEWLSPALEHVDSSLGFSR